MRNESNLSNKLNDEERAELAAILNGFPSKTAMNLEMLDGFFTALICCTRITSQSKHIHVIFGNKRGDAAPFDDIKQYQRFLDLLIKYWNNLIIRLRNDKFEPFLESAEENYGKAWATGFTMSIPLSKGAFKKIMREEKGRAIFASIFALSYDKSLTEEYVIKEEITPALRKELVDTLSNNIPIIYTLFKKSRTFSKNN